MFPLKDRIITGYRFMQPTFYSAHHLGTDYGREGLQVFSPFTGQIIFKGYGIEGGNTLWLKPLNLPVVIRFLHLSQFYVKAGQQVAIGQLIALTGNTGSQTTLGHLHLDISKNLVQLNNINNFIDPEKFDWGKEIMTNAVFVHKAGSQEYGFYLPALTADSIEDKALNLGYAITDANGNVDFTKAKEVTGL